MEEILEILKGTPWWVYPLVAYLMYVGYKISRPRTVQFRSTYLLPAILILLSLVAAIRSGWILSDITHTFGMKTPILYKWLWVTLGSFVVGFAESRKIMIQKGPNSYQLVSRGGYLTPFIIFLMFATKYYLGYSLATSPTKDLLLADLLASEFIAGYILGRSLSLGLKYYRKPVKTV